MLYVHLALQNGVAQASRYGVTGKRRGPVLSREDSIKAVDAERDADADAHRRARSRSAICRRAASRGSAARGGANDIDKVTVNYTWTMLTPCSGRSSPTGQMNFTVESAMKNERVFE